MDRKRKNVKLVSTVGKGICVGGTMLVPGCSGGSMAMMLGIYDKLVRSVSSFGKNMKGNLAFLSLFACGAMAGMMLFAKPVLLLTEHYYMPMMYFFIGAVAGSFPMIYRKAQIRRLSLKTGVFLLLGMGVILLFAALPAGVFQMGAGSAGSWLFLACAGVIVAVALVLPGISASYMLLLMGLYDGTVQALLNLRFSYLLPLGLGAVLGVLLCTRLLETAMNRYPGPVYLMILGFMAASMLEVFPGVPAGGETIVCLCAAAAGFWLISRIEGKESVNT